MAAAEEQQHDEEINPLVPYDIYSDIIPRSADDYDDDARFKFLLNAANEYILHEIEQNSYLKFRCFALLQIEWINYNSRNADAFVPYLAMTYADRILSTSHIPVVHEWAQANAHLFFCCCLTIASKMRNKNFKMATILQARSLVHNYTEDEVLEMELGICERLAWRMRPITPFCFVDFFIDLLSRDLPVHAVIPLRHIHQIIIRSLGAMEVIKYKPAEVGFAAVLVATTLPEDDIMVDLINNILNATQINCDSVHELMQRLKKLREEEPIPKLEWVELAWRTLLMRESVFRQAIQECCSALALPASYRDKGKAKQTLTQPGDVEIGGKGLGRGHDGASSSKDKAKQTRPESDEEIVVKSGSGGGHEGASTGKQTRPGRSDEDDIVVKSAY